MDITDFFLFLLFDRYRNVRFIKMSDLEGIDEEFNNFMYRVTEVNEIVKKLSSNDKRLQDIGTLEADKYLNDNRTIALKDVHDNDIAINVVSNRTFINKGALLSDDGNKDTMSKGLSR